MTSTTLLERKSISVSDFRCTAGPGDKPFAEQHCRHSISYVRKGSFGLHCRGKFSELVAGSVLIGHPGDEYTCTHEHVCGDECLSFFLAPELVEAIGDSGAPWQIGSAPPLPELVVLGELAQAAADGSSDIGLDEIGQVLASRFVEVVSGKPRKSGPDAARDRRRAVETALWIDANSHTRSTWKMPQRKPGSARSTSCGCSRKCSASRRTNIWCARGCATPRGGWPTTTARSPISPMMSASRTCPISCARLAAPPAPRR
jgi:hypothetical protein